jgi:hypothetical protein
LRAELRAKAAAEKVRPQLNAGAFEIMWALSKAHAEIVSQNLEQEFVLAAARRNFFLSWRPALSQGRFIRTDSEPWCLQFPEGSHRIDQQWAKERYQWLSPDRRLSALPDWRLQEKASEEADLEEISYVESEKLGVSRYFVSKGASYPVHEVHLECDEVDQDLFSIEARLLQIAPAIRRFNAELQEKLTDQKGIHQWAKTWVR